MSFCIIFIFFFFFKQKTAYEMRISDWSSDVCSSDLLVGDTTADLNALGAASRARTSARIIGVSGSVGKTGTKEALFHALDRYAPYAVHLSVKSYHNHVGVPLSLARIDRKSTRLNSSHKCATHMPYSA